MTERSRALPAPETGLHRRLIVGLTRRRPIRQTLMIVLVAALAPLAMLAAGWGIYAIRSDQQSAAQSVALAARQATAPGHHPLTQVDTMLALLASNPLVFQPACGTPLADASELLPIPAILVRLEPDGAVVCSSDGSQTGSRLPTAPLADGGPVVLRSAGGELAAILDPQLLVTHIAAPHPIGGAVALLADGNGRLIAGDRPPGWREIPPAAVSGSFATMNDALGRSWVVAAVPLTTGAPPEQQLTLMFAHRRAGLSRQDSWYYISSFALPLIALVLASFAIWFGANHSILRWVEELRRMTSEIADGNYRVGAERFDDAPIEVRDLAADAQRMARTIAERDRTLTEALDRQTALTLELNHRVRNNLQLISSYVTLQSALRAPDRPFPGPLDQVQLRVGALALVHRLLYGELERAEVPAARLLAELMEMIRSEWGGAPIESEAADVIIGIDSAIPVALAVIETESWVRQAGPDGRLSLRHVGLETEGVRARLCMRIEGAADALAAMTEPPRLLNAFARQLGGALAMKPAAGGAPGSALLCVIDIPLSSLDRGFSPNIGNNPVG